MSKWHVLARHQQNLIVRKIDYKRDKLLQYLNALDIADILLLMGQCRTRTSATDEKGLPPAPEELLVAAKRPYNAYLTQIGRAYTKHAYRSKYWQNVKGTPQKINHMRLAYVK